MSKAKYPKQHNDHQGYDESSNKSLRIFLIQTNTFVQILMGDSQVRVWRPIIPWSLSRERKRERERERERESSERAKVGEL
jgi:hypothetical protein